MNRLKGGRKEVGEAMASVPTNCGRKEDRRGLKYLEIVEASKWCHGTEIVTVYSTIFLEIKGETLSALFLGPQRMA